MQLIISHTTTYTYESPITSALQQVRLTPRDTPQQKVLDWAITVENGAAQLEFSDHHDNFTKLVSAEQGASEIRITASGTVETNDTAGVLGKVYGTAPLWLYKHTTPRTDPGKNIRRLAKSVDTSGETLSSLHALSAEILSLVPYETGKTFSGTTAEFALANGHGVCQDHAQIFVAACRYAGLPARYVSGYLMMNDRVDQDASHAWAEAWLDDLGWVGFDVSNGIAPDERYVRLACGLDSKDAGPISGIRRGAGSESMIVSLQVQQ
ncbi:transglutaminase domain-containing protein [Pseudahrensia aquimaris]|uniref:Transglutaminase domain-containing protein n=1 Tax=Pseudahrensia aquimaris TaxID=744461 RepID=A0ABW3FAI8_9HYPH